MAQIAFSIDGEKQLSRNLRLVVTKLSNLNEFYKDTLTLVDEHIDENFADHGKSNKNAPAWKPLSERTMKARSRGRGYYKQAPSNPDILRWTGKLQRDRTKVTRKDFCQLSMDAPYAIYHQRGGKNLPKRAIIDINDRLAAEIVRAFQTFIYKAGGIFGKQV